MTVLDTNVSRLRHHGHIAFTCQISDGQARIGFVYTCPRCGWEATAMKWRHGAIRHGDEHALDCPTANEAA